MIVPSSQLSNSQYHQHPAIGSSLAKKILVSPRLFRDAQEGIGAKEESPAMAFGTLCHTYFLERERFDSNRSQGPINEKTGEPYGSATKAYADWQSANLGAIVVSKKDMATLELMAHRMPGDVYDILTHEKAVTEESCFVESDGLPIKCRNDLRISTHIFDLKTCSNIDKLDYNIADFGYAFSASWYRHVMLLATGLPQDFTMIFAETAPPFRWKIVDLSADYIAFGDRQVKTAIDLIRTCQEFGDWSDRSQVHVTAELPKRWQP